MSTNPRHSHLRERSLTALVILEATGLFVIAPMATKIALPIVLYALFAAAILIAVLAVVWGNRAAGLAMLVAATVELLAFTLRVVRPSERTEILDFAAALMFLVTLTAVVGVAVFGPGRVTIHRILGAIAIYLNVAAAFALIYRVIDGFVADAFGPKGPNTGDPTITGLIYFSFVTLTTTGYGDIVPVDSFARSVANLEAVIGQLFPATLLARLITLELETRREENGSAVLSAADRRPPPPPPLHGSEGSLL